MTKPKSKSKQPKAPAKLLPRRGKKQTTKQSSNAPKPSARVAKKKPKARAARATKAPQLDPRALAAIAMALDAEVAAEQRQRQLDAPPSPWTSGGRLRRMQPLITR